MSKNSIERALAITKIPPIKDGVYVCVNAEKAEFKVLPLERIFVEVNGAKQPLGKVLTDLVNATNKIIDILIEKNNKEVK